MALNQSSNAKSRLISVRLPHETADKIDEEAKERGITRSDVIQEVLNKHFIVRRRRKP